MKWSIGGNESHEFLPIGTVLDKSGTPCLRVWDLETKFHVAKVSDIPIWKFDKAELLLQTLRDMKDDYLYMCRVGEYWYTYLGSFPGLPVDDIRKWWKREHPEKSDEALWEGMLFDECPIYINGVRQSSLGVDEVFLHETKKGQADCAVRIAGDEVEVTDWKALFSKAKPETLKKVQQAVNELVEGLK